MNNRNYIIGGIIVLAVITVAVWSFWGDDGGTNTGTETDEVQGREGEPLDVVSDFYSSWLSAVRSTSTDPYQEGLASDQALSLPLRDRLESTRDAEEERDPVLCQVTVPDNVRTKSIFENDAGAEFLILPSGAGVSGHAVVKLEAVEDRWMITGITCTMGESAPEREFSFEKEGNLLKSVPPPLDPQYWHLVFEENGQMGHTVPLFFDEQSTCISTDGSESVCDPDQFIQTKEALVQGEMSESGVTVKRLELLE